MSLLPYMYNWGLRIRRECRQRFPRHRVLAIPTCITTRAYRDHKLTVSVEVGGGENVPGIPGACTTRNFKYLLKKSPWITEIDTG